MHKLKIGDYLAPEIEEIKLAVAAVIAESDPFGEEGQAGSDIVESETFIL